MSLVVNCLNSFCRNMWCVLELHSLRKTFPIASCIHRDALPQQFTCVIHLRKSVVIVQVVLIDRWTGLLAYSQQYLPLRDEEYMKYHSHSGKSGYVHSQLYRSREDQIVFKGEKIAIQSTVCKTRILGFQTPNSLLPAVSLLLNICTKASKYLIRLCTAL